MSTEGSYKNNKRPGLKQKSLVYQTVEELQVPNVEHAQPIHQKQK